MHCFFCNSYFHLSQFCDNYASNESREIIVLSKNFCTSCLKPLNANHDNLIRRCENERKCFICFSKDHHTYFCPDRFSVPIHFLPRIDRDLFPRFLQIVNPDLLETNTMALNIPEIQQFLQPKPFKIVSQINNDNFQQFSPSTDAPIWTNLLGGMLYNPIAATTNSIINEKKDFSYNFVSTPSPSIIANYKINLSEIKRQRYPNSKIRSPDFLLLFTPSLRTLKCSSVSVFPDIQFIDILRKTPNIEVMDLHEANFINEETMFGEMLVYVGDGNLKKLKITMKSVKFDAKDLAALMKSHVKLSTLIITLIQFIGAILGLILFLFFHDLNDLCEALELLSLVSEIIVIAILFVGMIKENPHFLFPYLVYESLIVFIALGFILSGIFAFVDPSGSIGHVYTQFFNLKFETDTQLNINEETAVKLIAVFTIIMFASETILGVWFTYVVYKYYVYLRNLTQASKRNDFIVSV